MCTKKKKFGIIKKRVGNNKDEYYNLYLVPLYELNIGAHLNSYNNCNERNEI